MSEPYRTAAGTLIDPELEEWADDLEPDCHTCGGEGFEDCDDWDCWEPNCRNGSHSCPNCHGSGLAKDCTYQ